VPWRHWPVHLRPAAPLPPMARASHRPQPFSSTKTWSQFAWQGWRLDAPPDWNPVLLQGTEKRGAAILADLDATRIELTWLAWRGRKPPPLDPSIKRQMAGMSHPGERPASRWPLSPTFTDARELTSSSPREVRLVLNSPPSRRVLVVHLRPEGLPNGTALMRRIIAGLSDVSAEPLVPWSAYDLHIAVPQGFRLTASRLQAGGAVLTFAGHAGETLRFSRTASVGRARKGLTSTDFATEATARMPRAVSWRDGPPLDHLGHDVVVRHGRRLGLLPALRRSQRCVDLAVWHCPTSDRLFELIRRGPRDDDQLIYDMVRHAICHR
jgi:hypothetical protein